MNMKKYMLIALSMALLSSCEGWLGEKNPMVTEVKDFFTSKETADQVLTAVYTPLMWEFQNTYYSEFFFGDVMSDDALKGGQNISDMSTAYDLENFRTISNNETVLQFYRAQYQGIGRANLAIEQIAAMENDESFTKEYQDRLLGEAKFLRAYYYFRLVRLYGGVPLVTDPIYSADSWKQPRASVEDVYARICKDLEDAEKVLPNKSGYEDAEMGHVTKGAAQAMLLKAYLYQHNYSEAVKWGKKFMDEQDGSEYSLCPVYADNFTLAGENGVESVFEIQYMDEGMSDYGEGNGFSRGTFAVMLMRSRSAAFCGANVKAGWGFNKPTQNLYDEYEDGDVRRDATILNLTDGQITNPVEEIYLGNRYITIKRTMLEDGKYIPLSHEARAPINNIQIRLADVYLMYAEACNEDHDAATAKIYLEKVRARARGTEPVLPEFPGYSVPDYTAGYAAHALTDTEADLRLAIRHERRVELAMESHRWYDLCRWSIAKEVMDAYKATETPEAQAHMNDFVKGKHELLPIPSEEVRLGGLEQNFGY